jgi:hypothetical protein
MSGRLEADGFDASFPVLDNIAITRPIVQTTGRHAASVDLRIHTAAHT